MFREFVQLVEATVEEGAARGIDAFLTDLNESIKNEEMTESIDQEEALKKIFMENGIELSGEEETDELFEDEELNSKIDTILEKLKTEGLVD